MTTTSNSSKADNKGETAKTPRKQHLGGLEHLREQEVYHLTGLIKDCLTEAGQLVEKIHRRAGDRFTDFYGEKTEPLNFNEISYEFREVDDCLAILMRYLDGIRYCHPLAWMGDDTWTEQAPYPVYMTPPEATDGR